MWLKDAHRKKEIASLTKIMTCLVSIQIAERLKLNIKKLVFKVSEKSSKTTGTSANLAQGDQVFIKI